MGQYTPTTFSDNDALDAATLNAELAAIQTAQNTVNDGDIPASEISNGKLANPNADFIIPLVHHDAVGANQTYATAREEGQGFTPMACTVIAVTAIAGAVTVAAGNTGLKVYYNGAVMSNEISLAACVAATSVGYIDSSPVVTDLVAQKKLEIRVNNGAGDDASDIMVYLHCKKAHST